MTVFLDHVTKVYDGDVRAVDDVQLKVAKGELLVLLGPSGCGKSTILRMIAGLEEVTSGRLYLNGELANDLSTQDRNVAMVFQHGALYPHCTVRHGRCGQHVPVQRRRRPHRQGPLLNRLARDGRLGPLPSEPG